MKTVQKEMAITVAKITIDEAIRLSKLIELNFDDSDSQKKLNAKLDRLNKSLKDENESNILKHLNDVLSNFYKYNDIEDLIVAFDVFKEEMEYNYEFEDQIREIMEKFDDQEYSKKYNEIYNKKVEESRSDFYLQNSDKEQRELDEEWWLILHLDELLLSVKTEAEVDYYIENDEKYLKKYTKKGNKTKNKLLGNYGLDSGTEEILLALNTNDIDQLLVA